MGNDCSSTVPILRQAKYSTKRSTNDILKYIHIYIYIQGKRLYTYVASRPWTISHSSNEFFDHIWRNEWNFNQATRSIRSGNPREISVRRGGRQEASIAESRLGGRGEARSIAVETRIDPVTFIREMDTVTRPVNAARNFSHESDDFKKDVSLTRVEERSHVRKCPTNLILRSVHKY